MVLYSRFGTDIETVAAGVWIVVPGMYIRDTATCYSSLQPPLSLEVVEHELRSLLFSLVLHTQHFARLLCVEGVFIDDILRLLRHLS